MICFSSQIFAASWKRLLLSPLKRPLNDSIAVFPFAPFLQFRLNSSVAVRQVLPENFDKRRSQMRILLFSVHLPVLPVVSGALRQPDRFKGHVQSVGLGVRFHNLDLLRCHELPSIKFWRSAISTSLRPSNRSISLIRFS